MKKCSNCFREENVSEVNIEIKLKWREPYFSSTPSGAANDTRTSSEKFSFLCSDCLQKILNKEVPRFYRDAEGYPVFTKLGEYTGDGLKIID